MNEPVYLSLQILKISKIVIYEFWYNYVKPKLEKKKKLSYAIWVQATLQSIEKQTTFTQILQKMSEQDLIHHTMNQKDSYRKKKE